MYSELDSFFLKLKHLWHSGVNAHLDVNTHAGHAWVHLHVQLGQAPGPLHPQAYQPHHRKKDSPSRQRRRARRAEGRQNKKPAEEVPFKPTENVEAEIEVEEAPIKPTENVETELEAVQASSTLSESDQAGNDHEEQEVQIVNDELCPDDIYHQAESENIEQRAFRCLECRMLFFPTSHVDGSNILDFSSCRRHIGVQKCSSCKIVLVGLAKIRCHRQVCQHSA